MELEKEFKDWLKTNGFLKKDGCYYKDDRIWTIVSLRILYRIDITNVNCA